MMSSGDEYWLGERLLGWRIDCSRRTRTTDMDGNWDLAIVIGMIWGMN